MTADTGNGPDSGTGPWVARPVDWFSPRKPAGDDQPKRADSYDNGLDPSGQVDEWLVAADDADQGYWYDDAQGPADIAGPTAALNERPGGPGFTVPPEAFTPPPGEGSPWVYAEGAWRGPGTPWDQQGVVGDHAGPPWEAESVLQGPPVGARRGPRRRPAGRTVLKVGLPVVVIAVAGVGAALMLTGKTHGRATTPPVQAGTAGTAGRSGAAGAGAPGMAVSAAALPGYRGRGVSGEMVEGLASSGGTQLAVGTVDGLPAVWRRAGTGPWSLVTQNTAGITGRAAVLTTIQPSPRGWIAAGAPGGGAAAHPVVLVSADGRSWQVVDGQPSLSGPGGSSAAIAAGRFQDVVVGKVVNGQGTVAASWWSTDLRTWVRDGVNGGLNGRQPSQMNAATVTPQKFVAVGQHGQLPAVWLASDARDWAVMDLPLPAGATSAELTKVAARGDRLVALGTATTSGGAVPFAVTSADGGATWRQVPIAAPSGRTATVTALTVTASVFTAAGQAAGTNAIYWTSADGTAWSAPHQADPGITTITGLIAAGATVTGIGQSPAGHPVIWAAG